MSELIALKVITPERIVFEGDVEKFSVRSRGEVGCFEILPGHLPFTGTIDIGRVVLTLPGGEEKYATLFNGFALIEEDKATILVETSEWPEEIDLERAAKAKERAERNMKQQNMDFIRAQLALYRATERINVRNNQ